MCFSIIQAIRTDAETQRLSDRSTPASLRVERRLAQAAQGTVDWTKDPGGRRRAMARAKLTMDPAYQRFLDGLLKSLFGMYGWKRVPLHTPLNGPLTPRHSQRIHNVEKSKPQTLKLCVQKPLPYTLKSSRGLAYLLSPNDPLSKKTPCAPYINPASIVLAMFFSI